LEPSVIVEIYKHLFFIGKLVYDNYFNSGGSSVTAGFTIAVSALVSGLLAAWISIWGNARQQDKNIKLSLLDDLFRYKHLLTPVKDKTKIIEALNRVPIIFNDDEQIFKTYENLVKAIEQEQIIKSRQIELKELDEYIHELPKSRTDLVEKAGEQRNALNKLKNGKEDPTEVYATLLKLICRNLKVNIRDWDNEKIMRVINI